MLTLLATHAWLDNPLTGYRGPKDCRRVNRFLRHYGIGTHEQTWPTVVIDNGSQYETCRRYALEHNVAVMNAQPNFVRGPQGTHDYKNVWRAYWYLKHFLQKYDRIFYFATDAYVMSQRLLDYLDTCTSGWTSLWTPTHDYPAAEIQVITKCATFYEFFKGPLDVDRYNGQIEETVLPFTTVEKSFIGDRYGEWEEPYRSEMDYYTQVPDRLDGFERSWPVVRRVSGKAQMVKAP